MWTHPGKKLLFMGANSASGASAARRESEWHCCSTVARRRAALGAYLNHLYRSTPALHQLDFSDAGFRWSTATTPTSA